MSSTYSTKSLFGLAVSLMAVLCNAESFTLTTITVKVPTTTSTPSLTTVTLTVPTTTPTTITSSYPVTTIPASCYTTFDDWAHTTAWVSAEKCYTYTSTTSATDCPTCHLTTPLTCEAIAKVSIVTVPCSTDCCPVTPTAYVASACPPCGTCVIPTYYSTVTSSGCNPTIATPGLPSTTETPSCFLPEGCSDLTTTIPL